MEATIYLVAEQKHKHSEKYSPSLPTKKMTVEKKNKSVHVKQVQ